MESLEHNCGNILPTIRTNMLIFGKDTILVLIAWMILTKPISLQILIFVMSHFITLYACSEQFSYQIRWRIYFKNRTVV